MNASARGWMAAGCALAMVLSLVPVTASGASGNRNLVRLFEKRGLPAREGEEIERAMRAADRAGFAERESLALIDTCLGADFESAQVVRVLSLAAQLVLEGLPTESFVSKINEGVMKRVDPGKIVQVAERRALHLKRGKSLLDSVVLEGVPVNDREELIPDVAEALEAGRTAEEVREILTDSFRDGDGVHRIRQKLIP